MKLGETALKITNNGGNNKISSNKRDVSETDLYLLGTSKKNLKFLNSFELNWRLSYIFNKDSHVKSFGPKLIQKCPG